MGWVAGTLRNWLIPSELTWWNCKCFRFFPSPLPQLQAVTTYHCTHTVALCYVTHRSQSDPTCAKQSHGQSFVLDECQGLEGAQARSMQDHFGSTFWLFGIHWQGCLRDTSDGEACLRLYPQLLLSKVLPSPQASLDRQNKLCKAPLGSLGQIAFL